MTIIRVAAQDTASFSVGAALMILMKEEEKERRKKKRSDGGEGRGRGFAQLCWDAALIANTSLFNLSQGPLASQKPSTENDEWRDG